MQVKFTGVQSIPTQRMTKPTNFTGAVANQQQVSFTGVDYGALGQRVKDSFKSINFSGFFAKVKDFLTKLPERLKPVNDFLRNMFQKLWGLVKPITTKAP